MNRTFLALLAVLAALTAACGHKIGDECTLNSDCSTDGTRICDTFTPHGGYCTIRGCDFGTCPDEAVCVRFIQPLDSATDCSAHGQVDCRSDEICTIARKCAPRSDEDRFCMLTCESSSDCRDGFECRTPNLMKLHGGEPVPNPNGASLDANGDPQIPAVPFCASLRTCTRDLDCPPTELCAIPGNVCRLRNTCSSDAQCASGETCNVAAGYCSRPVQEETSELR